MKTVGCVCQRCGKVVDNVVRRLWHEGEKALCKYLCDECRTELDKQEDPKELVS
jgi:hypothetical protein